MPKLQWPSAYQLKKLILHPHTLYMRRKEKLQNGFMRAALELHYYRPSFYRYIEAFVANKHILHQAELNESSTVLDIGAYNGEWGQQIMDLYNPTLYAFEPNPNIFKELEKTAANYPKLHPVSYGIGAKTEQLKISMKGMGSSLFAHEGTDEGVQWLNTEIKSVDDVWKELGLKDVDLVKINIEGAEFPLLEKMIEADLLPTVKCFMIQFHEWHPKAYSRRRQIHKMLSKTHTLEWDYYFVWEKWIRKNQDVSLP